MGILTSGAGFALGAAQVIAEEKAKVQVLKRGKTPDQCRAIDFFYSHLMGGCFSSKSSIYTLDEYQQAVIAKLNKLNLRERAIQQIGLDESQIQEIPPILLTSYIFDDDALVKVSGNDAVSSQFSATWLFFSDTQLYTYKYIFDMTSDNSWEFLNDYFYKDVTCFSTIRSIKEKITVTNSKGCLKKPTETYTKSTYVVHQLEITVPGSVYSVSMRNSPNIENSIQAAKAMIREKKY